MRILKRNSMENFTYANELLECNRESKNISLFINIEAANSMIHINFNVPIIFIIMFVYANIKI